MPLTLDPRCIDQFRAALLVALEDASVMYGRYVHPDWMWIGERVARVLPQTQKARATAGLERIPNLTVSFFLMDQLRHMLREHGTANDDASVPLSDLPGFNNREETADKLIAALLTLPWDYELLILTPLDAYTIDEIPLDKQFTLRSIEAQDAAYPLHAVDVYAQHAYHQHYPEAFTADRYYFAGSFSGYLHDVSPVPEIEELVHAAKGVLGLALVATFLKLDVTSRGAPPPRTQPIIVYRIQNGARQLLPYLWLSTDDTQLLSRFERGALPLEILPTILAAIQAAFSHAATLGAARWYVDSFTGSNGVLQTVQATVALEMLLGDRKQSNQIGVTQLLSNRLAFLIGNSPRQRASIAADFCERYDVRSDIVHNGKILLDERERDTLFALRNYARRAILKQLEQIWAENGKRTEPATAL
jgi:hypothetical protein